MAEYRNDETEVRRGGAGAGRTVIIILAVVALIVAVLFATGFWRADVTREGALPDIDVSAKGGALPQVDVDSKSVVVGTTNTSIDVPKVTTEKETVQVPTVGVSEGETDKK